MQVHSKLATGRLPQMEELLQMLGAAMQQQYSSPVE